MTATRLDALRKSLDDCGQKSRLSVEEVGDDD
jgi:hypothetical protein